MFPNHLSPLRNWEEEAKNEAGLQNFIVEITGSTDVYIGKSYLYSATKFRWDEGLSVNIQSKIEWGYSIDGEKPQ